MNSKVLSWITSFLSNRQQKVVLDGQSSAEVEVLSGVPQGTVLGPVLFLCFINDIADSLSSTIHLFADDALLFHTIDSAGDAALLQEDLTKLDDWANTWHMEFNACKCYALHITNKCQILSSPYHLDGT